MNLKNLDKKLIIIIVISTIAIINAVYLTNEAFNLQNYINNSWSLFWAKNNVWFLCDLNETFSCSSVFKNDFAWILGIPFSLIALFVYPIIVILAILGLIKKINIHYKIILTLAILWILFNWYIIINEYLIWAYCILCLICTLIIIINWILSCVWIRKNSISLNTKKES